MIIDDFVGKSSKFADCKCLFKYYGVTAPIDIFENITTHLSVLPQSKEDCLWYSTYYSSYLKETSGGNSA